MQNITNPSACDTHTAVKQLVQLYEQLTPAHLTQLDHYYAANAHFKDPFNDVNGVDNITRVFTHMFATLTQPRFIITEQLVEGQQAFLSWEFHFRMRRLQPNVDYCIHGGTLVRFDTQGLVIMHRDYWDTAEELYAKIPVFGALMRWLRKTASATANASHTPNSDA
jgi:steroid delta-isomerase